MALNSTRSSHGPPPSRADVIERTYDRLAPVYDLLYGKALLPGRLRALERMGLQPGDRVLEVGVGSGNTLDLYPSDCRVVGLDISAGMLKKAKERVARERRPVVLLRTDATRLSFRDESFEVVYAPYVLSAVAHPEQVAREMWRVCRTDGRIVFLNHFLSERWPWRLLERLASPLTSLLGFRADLELSRLLGGTRLRVRSLERVNTPPLSLLVTCSKA